MKRIAFVGILVLILAAAAGFYFNEKNNQNAPEEKKETKGVEEESVLAQPLENSLTRITKKPFGLKVSPADSPVQPEKFSGYHTGTDFEVTEAEINKTIAVSAICEGQVILKDKITGYGGVMVQSCTIDGKAVNVIYGHVNIEDQSSKQSGSVVKKGEFLANLGADKSAQTDGERKHLHLGIFRGGEVDYRGYVQDKSELSAWLDFEELYR